MKKGIVTILVIFCIVVFVSCATTNDGASEGITAEVVAEASVPFEVGEDYTEYAMDGASSWASSYEAYLKVSAGEDVLFNGKVLLTSDNMWVGEFLHAAGLENGFSTDGALTGFVMIMGQYVGGTNDCYWSYTVNGKTVNWGCDQMHVLEGDYIEWTFAPMVW